jgi:hypothetical protein
MTTNVVRVRQNYLAILVASVTVFLLSAVWYTVFMKIWLTGIGRTLDSIVEAGKAAGMSEWMQYVTAFVCTGVMAVAISCVTQLTGPQTMARGVKVGALLWLGFVATVWATEYVFEVRPLSLFAVNAGFWLVGMVVIGAIVGGWKKKQVGSAQDVKAGATAMNA